MKGGNGEERRREMKVNNVNPYLERVRRGGEVLHDVSRVRVKMKERQVGNGCVLR